MRTADNGTRWIVLLLALGIVYVRLLLILLFAIFAMFSAMSPVKKVAAVTSHEKEILVSIISKYKDIVESKRNDAMSIVKKKQTWEKISHDFNSCVGVNKRTSNQLKKLWENIKGRAKKDIAKEIRVRKITGGGPVDKSIINTPDLSKVLAIVPSQIIPPANELDEDADPLELPQATFFEIIPQVEDNLVDSPLPSASGQHTHSDDEAQNDKIKETPKARKKLPSRMDMWLFEETEHKKRMALLEEQRQQQREKHQWEKDQYIQQKKEQEQRQEWLKLEHEQRIAQMKEFHDLQMQIAAADHAARMAALNKNL